MYLSLSNVATNRLVTRHGCVCALKQLKRQCNRICFKQDHRCKRRESRTFTFLSTGNLISAKEMSTFLEEVCFLEDIRGKDVDCEVVYIFLKAHNTFFQESELDTLRYIIFAVGI